MSSCEVYAIGIDGDVHYYDAARNAWGGAMHIWHTLGEKRLGRELSVFQGYDRVWKLFGTPALQPWENVALGFTFDRVWVRRENLPRLADALAEFWLQHHHPAPTIPALVEIIRRAAADEAVRGLCFNQTSVCSNPWRVRLGEDEGRPYNFDRDGHGEGGHWELFEEIDAPAEPPRG